MTGRHTPVWPVCVLALPAAVAIWAGWVGLGQMTGFGKVQLLPGVLDRLVLNTAVTLPIGLEAFSAYGMYVWLASNAPRRAKDFARVTSIVALLLGALGQISYHLMAAAGITAAPWQITAAVACVPIAVLGMAAALAHLIRDAEQPALSAVPTPPSPLPAAPPVAPFRPPMSAPSDRTTGAVQNVPQTALRVVPDRPDFVPAVRPGPAARTVPQDVPTTSRDDVPERSVDRPSDRSAGRPKAGIQTGLQAVSRTSRTASPDRSGGTNSDRPGTTVRTGPTRHRRAGKKPRTDAQLTADIRDLTDANGGTPPSAYQLKQRFGVGSERAQRLLELVTTSGGDSADKGDQDSGETRQETGAQ